MNTLSEEGNTIKVNRIKIGKLKNVSSITGNSMFMRKLGYSFSIEYLIDILKIIGYKNIELCRLKSELTKAPLLSIKTKEYTVLLAPILVD